MGSKSYSKGISWIDDCRIPFEDTQNPATNPKYRLQGDYKMPEKGQISEGSITQFRSSLNEIDVRGRFPANLLVCDDMLNDGNIIQYNKNRTDNGTYLGGHRKEYVGTDNNDVVKQIKGQFFNDKGSNSRYYDIDKWFDNLIDV
jgi:hypothetical protein